MSTSLTPTQHLELTYWMRLTRTFDERMLALWKQGRGVGGTFSQRGHEAISVGAEYVPAALLAEWEARDPLKLFETKLLAGNITDQVELDEIGRRCEAEVEDAIAYAEASPWPDPKTIMDGVYAY